ncbi:MAG: hypothetical protein MUF22_07620 [Chitinispirillaceae bacterium]|jgi:hypothetical protein|nr:hypothetical protein [Chitinispirillaceae bacterium]
MSRRFQLFCTMLAAALLAQCGSSGDNLAGGSGAGNPGGTVAIAMRAHIDGALPKVASAASADIGDSLVVSDRGGMKITVTGVELSSAEIHFVLDSSESPERLHDREREREPALAYDSNSLFLYGPFGFNALTGRADSGTHSAASLPVARYTGVALQFREDPVDTGAFAQLRHGKIGITGTLVYKGETHQFVFDFSRSFGRRYRFAGGIFTLSRLDTTHIELRFNARKWFSNVNIASGIERGQIGFNDHGELALSTFSGTYLSRELGFVISEDFIASGTLVVY